MSINIVQFFLQSIGVKFIDGETNTIWYNEKRTITPNSITEYFCFSITDGFISIYYLVGENIKVSDELFHWRDVRYVNFRVCKKPWIMSINTISSYLSLKDFLGDLFKFISKYQEFIEDPKGFKEWEYQGKYLDTL